MKTYSEAAKQLPEGSKWSSSFGYPGEGGYTEIHRTPAGDRWQITNGTWGDEWSCKPLEVPS